MRFPFDFFLLIDVTISHNVTIVNDSVLSNDHYSAFDLFYYYVDHATYFLSFLIAAAGSGTLEVFCFSHLD